MKYMRHILIGEPMKASACLGVFLLIAISTIDVSAQSSPVQPSAAALGREIPEHIIYELYFRRVALFNDLAAKNELQKINSNGLRSMIAKELGINSPQNELLLQTVSKCLNDASTLDAQADAIIVRERARYPGGRLTDKEQPPKIPDELRALQKARDLIFVSAKDKLMQQFGNTDFQILNSRIRAVIISAVKVEHKVQKP
jgi:hypothetical protein